MSPLHPERTPRRLLGTRFRGAGGLIRIAGTGALNQLIVSGTGFAYTLFLARALVPADFGRYGMALGACMLAASVVNALVLTQMSVSMADRDPEQRAGYGASTAILTMTLGVALGTVAVLADRLLSGSASGSDEGASWVLLALSIAWLLREFAVRFCYATFREARALRVNAVVAVTLLICTAAALAIRPDSFDATAALSGMAVAQGVAAVYGVATSGLAFRSVNARALGSDAVQAWGGGRWALAGAVCAWAQSQAYMYVTATTVGAAAVGLANAARLIVTPVTVFASAMYQLALPRLAARRAQGARGLSSPAIHLTLAMTGLAAAYGALAALFSERLAGHVLSAGYAGVAPLIVVWSIVAVLQAGRDGGSMLLQALRRFRYLTGAVAATSLIAVVAALVLSQRFGVAGAIAGTAIGEGLLVLLVWRGRARANAA